MFSHVACGRHGVPASDLVIMFIPACQVGGVQGKLASMENWKTCKGL